MNDSPPTQAGWIYGLRWLQIPGRLFDLTPGHWNPADMLLWWESRRIAFNWLILRHASCSLPLFLLFISLSGELKPGDDAVEPIALIVAPFAINLLYCLGWLIESALFLITWGRVKHAAPALMKLGVYGSLTVIWSPTLIWGFACLVRLVQRRL